MTCQDCSGTGEIFQVGVKGTAERQAVAAISPHACAFCKGRGEVTQVAIDNRVIWRRCQDSQHGHGELDNAGRRRILRSWLV